MEKCSIKQQGINRKKIMRIIATVFLCISGAVLSRLLAFPQDIAVSPDVTAPIVPAGIIQGKIGITVGCAAAVLFWLYASFKLELFTKRPDWISVIISGFIAIVTVRRANIEYGFPKAYSLASLIATWVGIYLIISFLGKLYKALMQDRNRRRFWIIASIVSVIVVIVLYSASDQLYQQYDKVYSMDGGWVFNNMYPMLNYYDVRHPMISIFYYPVFCFSHYVLKVVRAYSITNMAIMIQFVHVQMWLLTSLLLDKIAENKWMKWLYLASGPVMLYMVFFEKFAILVFLLVLTVYLIKENDWRFVPAIAAASGSILTSCVIALGIFFASEVRWKDRIKGFVKSVVFTILFFVAFGRLGTVLNVIPESQGMKGFLGTLTNNEKWHSYLNMIGSSFVSITPDIQPDKIWWAGLMTSFNILGLLVLLIGVYIAIRDWKRTEIRISVIWAIFSFVLVFGAGWSITESPLFAIYFSWALMLPVGRAFERIAKRVPDEKYVYLPAVVAMAALNLGTTLTVVFAAMRTV